LGCKKVDKGKEIRKRGCCPHTVSLRVWTSGERCDSLPAGEGITVKVFNQQVEARERTRRQHTTRMFHISDPAFLFSGSRSRYPIPNRTKPALANGTLATLILCNIPTAFHTFPETFLM
jgi:hypothetical protein